MKIRIGVGTGAAGPTEATGLTAVVTDLERLGFDSLWLSEVLTAPAIDPLVGLAYAAGCTQRLKLGTTMVLPGRNPVRVAKELATLDRLSQGRLLVTFVLGLRQSPELEALGVPAERRGAEIDRSLPVVRRLWAGEEVDGVRLHPLPVQQPLEPWLAGNVPSALRRTGRLADGWLPSLCTPAEAVAGRDTINRVAAEAGREIDPEHFGMSIGYASRTLPEATYRSVAARRPGEDPAAFVPVGLAGLRDLVERFVAVGFSKFVVRPVEAPADWTEELEALAAEVLPLQG